MRASPLETYKVGTCYKCGCDVLYNESEEIYIFTGREHCDCVRERPEEAQADSTDSDSRFPER